MYIYIYIYIYIYTCIYRYQGMLHSYIYVYASYIIYNTHVCLCIYIITCRMHFSRVAREFLWRSRMLPRSTRTFMYINSIFYTVYMYIYISYMCVYYIDISYKCMYMYYTYYHLSDGFLARDGDVYGRGAAGWWKVALCETAAAGGELGGLHSLTFFPRKFCGLRAKRSGLVVGERVSSLLLPSCA